MSKQCFRWKDFGPDALTRIAQCDELLDEYQQQGFRMTLRQLYYQLVSRDIIPNEEKSYKKLGVLVSDARLAGLLDWDAIEDRGRSPSSPFHWDGVDDVLRSIEETVAGYTLDQWRGQDCYVELWVEKDALAGVLQPLAHKHHVTLMVNKGYSSQSAMYESAQRFLRRMETTEDEGFDKIGVLFYLGDLDPSGEDMVRDIRERLAMFGAKVEVYKIALTMEQVKLHKPPPNPAKVTDPRAAGYIAKYGNKSWEVDALPPPVLARIIDAEIDNVLVHGLRDAVLAQEKRDKKKLTTALASVKRGAK